MINTQTDRIMRRIGEHGRTISHLANEYEQGRLSQEDALAWIDLAIGRLTDASAHLARTEAPC